MIENAVARRYAEALFDLAVEKNIMDQLLEDLSAIAEAIKANPELKALINHQLVSPEKKRAVLNGVFEKEVSEITMNFVNVLIEKHRESYLLDIYEAFEGFVNKARNIYDAEVIGAVPLSDDDVKLIQEKLSAKTGKNIRLTAKVDPSLMGGVVVRMGDKIIDNSVVSSLAKLKNQLLQIQVKEIGVRN